MSHDENEQPIDVEKESEILLSLIKLLDPLPKARRKRIIQAAETFLETKTMGCRG